MNRAMQGHRHNNLSVAERQTLNREEVERAIDSVQDELREDLNIPGIQRTLHRLAKAVEKLVSRRT